MHPSWVFILIVFTRISQAQFSRIFTDQFPAWQAWGVGFLTSACFFLSVLLRELGNSFIALNEGVKVHDITLFSLGGIKRVDKQCSTPMGSLRIAIAGPLINIAIGILCLSCAQIVDSSNLIFLNLLSQVGVINFLLALFNLLPGLPLDGGVILKSIVWHFTGSQRKGHRAANASGRFFSLIVIFLGGLIAFAVKGGFVLGFCLIVIGWFGLSSSRSQDQIIVLQQALYDLSVKDASRKRFRVLEHNQSLKALSELRLSSQSENGDPQLVLLCNLGRWTGYITDKLLMDVPAEDWDQYLLSEYSQPLTDLPSISEKRPLWYAVLELERVKGESLLVLNPAGLPSGTIDRVDLSEVVLKKLGFNLPRAFLDLARKNNIYPLGISLFKIVEGMIDSGLIPKSELDKVTK
ncbi:site-2 protease family protein [Prochlorococcus marinus]|uniref:site-2 protease family protein n=1 Tax=Prochlorococcus marinus TaxID=1219 RepID=UPI001F4CB1B1|nr:site-2 protease family protein [Prochlorococcus marinus]